MITPKTLILVTGATGLQGGATAHELLAHGCRVRILSRNPDSPTARALIQAGAEAVRADMGDASSVEAAMQDVTGVFSVQLPDVSDNDSERIHGINLIQSAIKAGIQQFVHTSVTGTEGHTNFPRWGTGYWWEKYWTDKWDIEEAVRHAGFSFWTVLRPAFMMDNFAMPKADFMFPDLRQGEIATALHTNTRLQLISADDVGAFAYAAFENPVSFNRKNIDLAAEACTMSEVAATLGKVMGKRVFATELTPEQAVTRGFQPLMVNSQEWMNEVGYQVDIEALRVYGIPLTSLEQWAWKHRAEIVID